MKNTKNDKSFYAEVKSQKIVLVVYKNARVFFLMILEWTPHFSDWDRRLLVYLHLRRLTEKIG